MSHLMIVAAKDAKKDIICKDKYYSEITSWKCHLGNTYGFCIFNPVLVHCIVGYTDSSGMLWFETTDW